MAAVWLESDVPALTRLGNLLELQAKGKISAIMVGEIRQIEDRFGLSPKSRHMLQWYIPLEDGGEGDDLEHATEAGSAPQSGVAVPRTARCRDAATAAAPSGRGYQVWDLIEAKCAIPDGDTPASRSSSPRRWRGSRSPLPDRPDDRKVLLPARRPARPPAEVGQGAVRARDRSAPRPTGAVFDGWDADGQPGRPAVGDAAGSRSPRSRRTRPRTCGGAAADDRARRHRADIPDTGQTRINLPGGGRIEPVTSSRALASRSARHFAVQDRRSRGAANGGRALADNQRRNIAGMGGRFLDDRTRGIRARSQRRAIHGRVTARASTTTTSTPGAGLSVRNKRERRKMLKNVYGDSYWVDLDRIDAEIEALLARDEAAQAERWFLNRKLAGGRRVRRREVGKRSLTASTPFRRTRGSRSASTAPASLTRSRSSRPKSRQASSGRSASGSAR
jgi:hypothetical protein